MVTLPLDLALTQFIKPRLDTLFHIDYSWWDQQGLDLNVKLVTHLCPEHRNAYAGQPVGDKIDWVDWETGEVMPVDGLQYIIRIHCSKEPDYVVQAPTMIEAVFRAFLSTSNQPMTSRTLGSMVGCLPERVLRLLAGRRVQLGLRPILRR
ncbi:MAG: hypothetical protein MUQ30_09725 [Anaerolineae bacterium]|nr:hypothetical protein [Anaerolineae bacterium]